MVPKITNKNIVEDLMAMQTGLGRKCMRRCGQGILKKLIASPIRYYKNVYEYDLEGHAHINLLNSGRLLVRSQPILSNMTPSVLCLPGYFTNKEKLPVLYKFPAKPRCKNVLVWEPSSSLVAQELIACKESHTSSVVYLTSNSFLIRRCLLTGKEKEKVFLGPPIKFENIEDQRGQGRIVLSSKLKKKGDVMITFAIFTSPPLQLYAVFQVCRSVFGKTAQGASISSELLYVTHKNNIIKAYSMDEILQNKTQELRLGQEVKEGTVGEKPLGVPTNVKITKEPRVMWEFDVKLDQFIIGGNPLQYIITPNYTTKEIRLMDSDELLATLKTPLYDGHVVNFHTDGSERIFHSCKNYLELLKVSKEGVWTTLRYDAPDVGPPNEFGMYKDQELITAYSPEHDMLAVLRLESGGEFTAHNWEEVVMLDNSTGAQMSSVDLGHHLVYAPLETTSFSLDLDGASMLISVGYEDENGEERLYGKLFCLVEKDVEKFGRL